ncbi:MAG: hypothetical protein ACKVQK_25270 [Burkholderiales bacterium]
MDTLVTGKRSALQKRLPSGLKKIRSKPLRGVVELAGKSVTAARDSDPIFALGSKPSKQNLRDGAERHDKLVYRGRFDAHFSRAGFEIIS